MVLFSQQQLDLGLKGDSLQELPPPLHLPLPLPPPLQQQHLQLLLHLRTLMVWCSLASSSWTWGRRVTASRNWAQRMTFSAHSWVMSVMACWINSSSSSSFCNSLPYVTLLHHRYTASATVSPVSLCYTTGTQLLQQSPLCHSVTPQVHSFCNSLPCVTLLHHRYTASATVSPVSLCYTTGTQLLQQSPLCHSVTPQVHRRICVWFLMWLFAPM